MQEAHFLSFCLKIVNLQGQPCLQYICDCFHITSIWKLYNIRKSWENTLPLLKNEMYVLETFLDRKKLYLASNARVSSSVESLKSLKFQYKWLLLNYYYDLDLQMKTKSNSNMCIKIKKSTQDSWKDLDYGIALSRLDKGLRSKLKTKWLHDKWLEGL